MWILAVKGLSLIPCWFLNLSTSSRLSRFEEEIVPIFHLNTTGPTSLEEVDVILTDLTTVMTPGFTWATLNCHVLMVAGRLRRTPKGWFAFRRTILHQQVGGVSDAFITFHLLTKVRGLHEHFDQLTFLVYPCCTLDSLLDCTISQGRRWPSATPPPSCMVPTEVYPWRSDPLVLCPAVLGSPYRVRKLSFRERCAVADLPSSCVDAWSSDLTRLLSFVSFPLKLYTVCLQHLFFYGSPTTGGGCFLAKFGTTGYHCCCSCSEGEGEVAGG